MINEPVNCQACGTEYSVADLKTVKLSGFTHSISICEKCISKTAEDCFKDAASLLNDIISIAKTSSNDPELRLKKIRFLIGD